MNKINIQIPLSQEKSLEGRLFFHADASRNQGMVICPPHPLLAGNMANNVVKAIANNIATIMPVLIFNYQAVGKSYKPSPVPLFEHWQLLDKQKEFREVITETRATLKHACHYFKKIHLVGYSFGSFIAHHCLNPDCLSFTAITPPFAEHNFSALNMELPDMIVWAAKDKLLTPHSGNFFSENTINKEIKDADHFFIHHEDKVAQAVMDFIA